mgnify:CR=1 FL=1
MPGKRKHKTTPEKTSPRKLHKGKKARLNPNNSSSAGKNNKTVDLKQQESQVTPSSSQNNLSANTDTGNSDKTRQTTLEDTFLKVSCSSRNTQDMCSNSNTMGSILQNSTDTRLIHGNEQNALSQDQGNSSV